MTLTEALRWLVLNNSNTATVVISFSGVVVAAITLVIVIQQLRLMERQLTLMGRQDEIIARGAKLITKIEYNSKDSQFSFITQNIGKKGVNNFDWHVWVPEQLGNTRQIIDPYGSGSTSDFKEEINGQTYCHFKGSFRDFIYPTRAKVFARFDNLPPNPVNGKLTFYTQIACDDGVFPEQVQEVPLTIKIA